MGNRISTIAQCIAQVNLKLIVREHQIGFEVGDSVEIRIQPTSEGGDVRNLTMGSDADQPIARIECPVTDSQISHRVRDTDTLSMTRATGKGARTVINY